MLGQRRRRWANIKISLFQRVVFAGSVGRVQMFVSSMLRATVGVSGGGEGSRRYKTLIQCSFNDGPPSTRLVQQ